MKRDGLVRLFQIIPFLRFLGGPFKGFALEAFFHTLREFLAKFSECCKDVQTRPKKYAILLAATEAPDDQPSPIARRLLSRSKTIARNPLMKQGLSQGSCVPRDLSTQESSKLLSVRRFNNIDDSGMRRRNRRHTSQRSPTIAAGGTVLLKSRTVLLKRDETPSNRLVEELKLISRNDRRCKTLSKEIMVNDPSPLARDTTALTPLSQSKLPISPSQLPSGTAADLPGSRSSGSPSPHSRPSQRKRCVSIKTPSMEKESYKPQLSFSPAVSDSDGNTRRFNPLDHASSRPSRMDKGSPDIALRRRQPIGTPSIGLYGLRHAPVVSTRSRQKRGTIVLSNSNSVMEALLPSTPPKLDNPERSNNSELPNQTQGEVLVQMNKRVQDQRRNDLTDPDAVNWLLDKMSKQELK